MSYESECHLKVRHLSRREAKAAAKRLKGHHMNAYACTHCGLWHAGHWNPHVRGHRIT